MADQKMGMDEQGRKLAARDMEIKNMNAREEQATRDNKAKGLPGMRKRPAA